MDASDFEIRRLGKCTVDSPLGLSTVHGDSIANFVDASRRVALDPHVHAKDDGMGFELAGPRQGIFFDPAKLRAAIVTCGGICPGTNNVIRGLVMQLHHRYGVERIVGVRYGLRGFIPGYGLPFVDLGPGMVARIHQLGGTILGSSRGPQDPGAIVDTLERQDVNIVFFVGGDGTLRAAHRVARESLERGLKIAVVGVPKTIDNDILYIDKSFGMDTAVSVAAQAVRAAHVEAEGAPNGLVIVKLMGRHSGCIACRSALATMDANLVLVPEQDFDLDGERGVFACVQRRFDRSDHMLIVVAEGAGQELMRRAEDRMSMDPSGNLKLQDIGMFLCNVLRAHFSATNLDLTIRYIDPSYIIRAAPANASDGIFCAELAEMAVHAAMAGCTDMVVGSWGGRLTHVPLELATSGRKTVDLEGSLWLSVLEATGQPLSMKS
jgi:6-phosphofructokinase 1